MCQVSQAMLGSVGVVEDSLSLLGHRFTAPGTDPAEPLSLGRRRPKSTMKEACCEVLRNLRPKVTTDEQASLCPCRGHPNYWLWQADGGGSPSAKGRPRISSPYHCNASFPRQKRSAGQTDRISATFHKCQLAVPVINHELSQESSAPELAASCF